MDRQEFQRDIAMEFRVACAIHFSHPARSDGFKDFIRSNSCSGEHLQTPSQQHDGWPIQKTVWVLILLEQRLICWRIVASGPQTSSRKARSISEIACMVPRALIFSVDIYSDRRSRLKTADTL